MHYIVFDLEWNSVKSPKDGKYINEIIEIGACAMDARFKKTQLFHQPVKPVISKKLNKYVRELTHITEDELKNAEDFKTAINTFADWCRRIDKDCVFLSWSNTDLHVLLENYITFFQLRDIPFMQKYCDLQKYSMQFINNDSNQQISLSSAADYFEIDTDQFSLHRACDDSMICAQILKLTYQKKQFGAHVIKVKETDYYERLLFKPYYITDLNDPAIDQKEFIVSCPACKTTMNKISSIKMHDKAFHAIFKCKTCNKKYGLTVRFKKTFDSIVVTRAVKGITPKQKKINVKQ